MQAVANQEGHQIEAEVSHEKLCWKEDNLEPKLHGKANGEELEG